GPKQRRCSRIAGSGLGHSVLLDDPREGRLAVGEGFDVRTNAARGPDHQAMLAAYSATAAALETLRLSIALPVGRRASASQCSRVLGRRPAPSAPSTSATRGLPSASRKSVSESPARPM